MQRSETIQLDGATAASVNIIMAVGSLRVSGGAGALMEADFTYDEELQPLIEHVMEGDRANVGIEQDTLSKRRTTRNEWDIRLNDELPLGLWASLAAADATLDLCALTLESLAVSTAAGDTSIHAGSDQPVLKTVSADSASGDIELILDGTYPQVEEVTIQSAAGDIELDLSGTWLQDLDVTVEAVAGNVSIRVPAGVGVAVNTTTMVGRVKLDGFRHSEHGQVNSVFGTSDVTLYLQVTTVSGNVTVQEVG